MSSTDPAEPTTSWVKASACGLAAFQTLTSITYDNWCFQSTILLLE